MKKAAIVLSLAVFLCVSLSACSDMDTEAAVQPKFLCNLFPAVGSGLEDAKEFIDAAKPPVENTGTKETAVPPEETAPAAQDNNSEEEHSTKRDLHRGSVNGNVYENKSIGIACSLDEDWNILTDEELAQLVGLTVEAFDNQDFSEIIQNCEAIYDFYALKGKDYATVSVLLENIDSVSLSNSVLDSVLEMQIPQIKAVLQDAGAKNLSFEIVSYELGRGTYPVLSVTGELYGMAIYEKMLLLMCEDNTLAYITAASFVEDQTDKLLSSFYLLDDL